MFYPELVERLINGNAMITVNKNLKFLRTQQGLTQKQMAEKLGVKTSAIGAYEEERATPPLTCLLEVSAMFSVSLDQLVQKDLSAVPEKKWKEQQFSRGKEVLAITVDTNNKENIELVSQKASAGYMNGFQDPEFVAELPKISLPMLAQGTYRAFEIKGDSMLPILPGTIVFGEYVESLNSIKSGKPYILLIEQEGVVFKRVFNFLEKERKFLLVSDNKQYDPYAVAVDDVLEVWSVKGFFATQFPEIETSTSVSVDHLAMNVLSLQDEVQRLKRHK